MTTPDISKFRAIIADEDPRDTFAGVGNVLSEWEGIEVGLCRIYSFFVGDPDGDAMRKYGQPRIFRDRFNGLLRVANQFFISHHDQDLEGLLDRLEGETTDLSDKRNDIAHGIVMPINSFSFATQITPPLRPRTNYWALMPAYYQVRQHDPNGMPEFIYGATALLDIANQMKTIYSRLVDYRETLRSILWQREQH